MGGMKNTRIILILVFLGLGIELHSFPKTPPYSDQECLTCHAKINIAQVLEDGSVRSLFVDPEEWSQDVHQKGHLSCVDCHIAANPYVHFREGFLDVDCAKCHPEQAEEYLKNVHYEFMPVSRDKELPLCYDCHTKHHILRHDDPSASINTKNIEATCGECHPEVMVKSILKGASLGKISGHRKGDVSEKFDMAICIQCHNPAHGTNTVYQDFCTRCHNPEKTADIAMGPTHLNSAKWMGFNTAGDSIALLLVLGTFVFLGYRSRKTFAGKLRDWHNSMKIEEELTEDDKEEANRNEIKKADDIKEDKERQAERDELKPEKTEGPIEEKGEPERSESEQLEIKKEEATENKNSGLIMKNNEGKSGAENTEHTHKNDEHEN
jgi:hypothetical protein